MEQGSADGSAFIAVPEHMNGANSAIPLFVTTVVATGSSATVANSANLLTGD
jgi:hypothetical protein